MNAIADRQAGRTEPPTPIALVIEQHGAWRVLAAAILGIFEGRGRPGHCRLGDLNNHLRQDIGLPPMPPRRSEPLRWM
ncbi:hypothetical protein Ga0609869_003192 [Rhodovulum iodosum]|uniref:DUF1127 domain-containing protein n=1 Tax=Rhodovulum iodosum TaxID=68291 RepID=A0ABV3XX05_9RHOB|nr:hypothetical protein [Rhodovulum robiginosum]RSK34126.1 hypothetical protein EJA01_08335 [Rhodovulum robiginosum]